MIHQHFKLVDVFSATENIVLGIEDGKYDLSKSKSEIKKISEQYGFDLALEKKMVFSRKRQDSPSSDDIIAVLAGKMMKNFLTLLAFPVNDSCRCAAERV